MLQIPSNLISMKDQQIIERPKDSQFSRFFPRITGTPPRWRSTTERFKPKRDWSKYGCHAELTNFLDWMDQIVQTTKFELTNKNLLMTAHMLFTRYADSKGIRGKQKATIKRFLDIAMIELRSEMT